MTWCHHGCCYGNNNHRPCSVAGATLLPCFLATKASILSTTLSECDNVWPDNWSYCKKAFESVKTLIELAHCSLVMWYMSQDVCTCVILSVWTHNILCALGYGSPPILFQDGSYVPFVVLVCLRAHPKRAWKFRIGWLGIYKCLISPEYVRIV